MEGKTGFDANSSINKMLLGVMSSKKGLRYKGFLVLSINERRDLPSVGHRSAMSRGIIIDDNGKMRCPAGTPNANQFTDINMSNCMVPSAETVANEAVDLAKAVVRTSRGFRQGQHGSSKQPEIIPDSGVGFADAEGFSQQRKIEIGNVAKNPIDGVERVLNKEEDSIAHVKDGGSLEDVPDTHLMSAILNNIGDGKRFTIIGQGGGIHGMMRLRDENNGSLIGIKYIFRNHGRSRDWIEGINEISAATYAEHLGYEPMPMRAVLGARAPGTEPDTPGDDLSIVTELAHHRRAGEIESARIGDREGKYEYDVPPEDLVRMSFLDAIIANKDRHEGNFLIQNNGDERRIIPIDHSLAFGDFQFGDNIKTENLKLLQMSPGAEEQMRRYSTDEEFEELVNLAAKQQEELRKVDVEKIRTRITESLEHIKSQGIQHMDVEDAKITRIEAPIARIQHLQNADPREIAEAMWPKWKRDSELKRRASVADEAEKIQRFRAQPAAVVPVDVV